MKENSSLRIYGSFILVSSSILPEYMDVAILLKLLSLRPVPNRKGQWSNLGSYLAFNVTVVQLNASYSTTM